MTGFVGTKNSACDPPVYLIDIVHFSFQCIDGLDLPTAPFLFAVLLTKWEMPWARVFPLRLLVSALLLLLTWMSSVIYPLFSPLCLRKKDTFLSFDHRGWLGWQYRPQTLFLREVKKFKTNHFHQNHQKDTFLRKNQNAYKFPPGQGDGWRAPSWPRLGTAMFKSILCF